MIKKIPITQLQVGMFIHDLNCGWLDHPFMSGRFKIKDAETIAKIAQLGIHEVYIDTKKGLDLQGAQAREQIRPDSKTREIDARLSEVQHSSEPARGRSPIGEELAAARCVQHEAQQVIHSIMEDARLGRQIELERIEPVVREMTESIFRNPDALLSLGRMKRTDEYTFMHSVSVCALMVAFCRAMELPREVIEQVGMGALVHDIGKMRVPLEVLNKPGRLTEAEFTAMRQHVDYGCEILEGLSGVSETALTVAAQHHERLDGTGYPHGLRGDQITLTGQMASIVDVYDAITSDRVYHRGMPPTDALSKLLEWSKFHFRLDLVQKFIRTVGIYPVGMLVKLENGLLGVVLEQRKSLVQPLIRIVFNTRSRSFIPPRDVELSELADDAKGYRILGQEPAERWLIDPLSYLAR
jgi:putative nucleotidyltransferase with HDIG domain